MTPSILQLFQLSYRTYWLGQVTGCLLFRWLPGHLCAASHWLPGGEWEESSPHPSPVAERVNVKTLSLPIICATQGFGVCLRACVCWREKRDKERERVREGEAISGYSPPFSLPVSLSLHPSSLLLDHPPALPRARLGPPYHLDHPGTLWLSLLLRPTNQNIWEGKTGIISACTVVLKSTSCPLLSSPSARVFVFMHSLVSAPPGFSAFPACIF